ncbi:hypothetical protein EYC84_002549 [Monilinia fructicola]|uniref:Uncharacterized protein n=1 Tax=Monilinia fructicola TaxID=38448 RepID=A0A5M9JTP3_MONFR|nr:hypothetical protein EYC84_002549 [Monilinia fructicola]
MPSSIPANVQDGPIVKRQKLNSLDAPKKTLRESRIFTPFRTIGLVSSTSVPFTSIPSTYDLKRGLNLVFLTRPQTPADITATVAWKDKVFAAWGGQEGDGHQGLCVFKRGKRIEEIPLPADLKEPIQQILVFGTWIVGCCSNQDRSLEDFDIRTLHDLVHYRSAKRWK